MAWPATWDRSSVHGAIEEASGAALSVDDALADTLIARAQELRLHPIELKLWVYDLPKPDGWTADALTRWARRNGIAREAAASGTEEQTA
jgi:hypothetical protein